MSEKNGVTERDGIQEYQYFVDGQWRTADTKRARGRSGGGTGGPT